MSEPQASREMTSDELLDTLDQHNLVPDVPFQNYPRMAVERARREAVEAALTRLRGEVSSYLRTEDAPHFALVDNTWNTALRQVLDLIDRAALPDRPKENE